MEIGLYTFGDVGTDPGTGHAIGPAQRLRNLASRWKVDELAIVTWTWDPAAQRRSYELLAAACGLA